MAKTVAPPLMRITGVSSDFQEGLFEGWSNNICCMDVLFWWVSVVW